MDATAQSQWRATVAARLPAHDWPEQRVLITVVDAHTGEPVVFDRDSGVELVDVVAASRANGFGVAPYRIGDRRYTDGGYLRNESADLASGYERVLVHSPFSGRTRHPVAWGCHSRRRSKSCARVAARSRLPSPTPHHSMLLGRT